MGTIQIEQEVFSKKIVGIGVITLRPLNLKKDVEIIHNWVTQPYAKYWDMLTSTKEEVLQAYKELDENPHHHVYIGTLDDEPIFLMERYKASEDIIGELYNARLNDYGMHVLVAPVQKRIPKFTWHVFSTIMDYFFSLPYVERVVVEPDENNDKIHVLNKKAGFVYQGTIQLPNKVAALAICTREDYEKATEALKEI
ncbi:Alcaligin biosynthesis complex, short chain [Tenacibaculum sp. 190524A02b]|uniref:GNAT family N-acetyltransferase n=1 Tax=Tenacibaculum vairaonense TaxID=3137860 RepID=UPI0032B1E6A2